MLTHRKTLQKDRLDEDGCLVPEETTALCPFIRVVCGNRHILVTKELASSVGFQASAVVWAVDRP